MVYVSDDRDVAEVVAGADGHALLALVEDPGVAADPQPSRFYLPVRKAPPDRPTRFTPYALVAALYGFFVLSADPVVRSPQDDARAAAGPPNPPSGEPGNHVRGAVLRTRGESTQVAPSAVTRAPARRANSRPEPVS
ncbi:hypothetical protein Arub01_04200 [Actinomadura rubrobrunea]|uniref:Uncharacterized protein n=1 Tax=Actinomadura rubrobrunea TaxID=115335 RepID=A0A9W6US12_9ACTN|nr:hypothetical protein Arub01_04200 [Actinomadura rubrobrunea]